MSYYQNLYQEYKKLYFQLGSASTKATDIIIALINNEKRSLSIRVKSENCKLLKLDRETFQRILGSI